MRFGDTDMFGHVNNAVYSSVYETGRTSFFIDTGLFNGGKGVAPVIVRSEIDYVREMNWPGTVQIETVIRQIGTKSFHTYQRATLGGELVTRSVGVMVVLDPATRRSVPLTEEWRTVLERYLDPDFV